jgi:hypothetical protein
MSYLIEEKMDIYQPFGQGKGRIAHELMGKGKGGKGKGKSLTVKKYPSKLT